jgi:protein-tyrosine phosphatase
MTTDFQSCQYRKVSTVAKLVPSPENVAEFKAIVLDFWGESPANRAKDIAVHCHYGFNRTGFLIASVLIEEFGYVTSRHTHLVTSHLIHC